jgi:site-specific DNA-methyltransferase (adenine-specific)
LASVTKIEYTGTIFCPTVSTGAFVARRNGKIFITGNSGFPKSLDVGKAVGKLQGNERENIGIVDSKTGVNKNTNWKCSSPRFYEATKGTSEWEGWGTALKPALEPITVARKPISEKNIAENVLKWGAGGINIDESRVGTEQTRTTIKDLSQAHGNQFGKAGIKYPTQGYKENPPGRFPANFIHDGSPEVLELFPTQGEKSEARFFYCAKASKKDRNEGLDGFEDKLQANAKYRPSHLEKALEGDSGKPHGRYTPTKNNHPTVKPTELMLYLIKLVTKPEGITLDPFMGSGSTGKAAARGNFKFIGIEREQDFYEIAQARINHETSKPKQQTFDF